VIPLSPAYAIMPHEYGMYKKKQPRAGAHADPLQEESTGRKSLGDVGVALAYAE